MKYFSENTFEEIRLMIKQLKEVLNCLYNRTFENKVSRQRFFLDVLHFKLVAIKLKLLSYRIDDELNKKVEEGE